MGMTAGAITHSGSYRVWLDFGAEVFWQRKITLEATRSQHRRV